MSRQIPSILPQPRGATVTPPENFKLSFAPASYNPYIFMERSRTKPWRAMLGTMDLYLDMEGEAPPTASEAWAALLADQRIADHPTELPPVNDRRLALEVISRRAHVSRTLFGGTKAHVHAEAMDIAVRVTPTPATVPRVTKVNTVKQAKPKEQPLGEFIAEVHKANKVEPLDPPEAKVVKTAADYEDPNRYKIPLFDPSKMEITKGEAALLKDATGQTITDRINNTQTVGEFVEQVRKENKEQRAADIARKTDEVLEEIAAFKLRQEVEAETARRLAEQPKAPEWEGF